MAGEQCEFSAKKAGKRPLFDKIRLEFQILYQWTPYILIICSFLGLFPILKNFFIPPLSLFWRSYPP